MADSDGHAAHGLAWVFHGPAQACMGLAWTGLSIWVLHWVGQEVPLPVGVKFMGAWAAWWRHVLFSTLQDISVQAGQKYCVTQKLIQRQRQRLRQK